MLSGGPEVDNATHDRGLQDEISRLDGAPGSRQRAEQDRLEPASSICTNCAKENIALVSEGLELRRCVSGMTVLPSEASATVNGRATRRNSIYRGYPPWFSKRIR